MLRKCIYFRLCLACLYTDVTRLMTCHFCTWHCHLKVRKKLLKSNFRISRRIDTCSIMRGYSSVVEHSTADREVHGSTPCAPFERFLTHRKFLKWVIKSSARYICFSMLGGRPRYEKNLNPVYYFQFIITSLASQ